MFRLPDALTAFIIRAGACRTKAERMTAARRVAELLRAAAPISDSARTALATLFAGEFKPAKGRYTKSRDLAKRLIFRLEVDELREREGLNIDDAIARLCPRRTAFDTARDWYYAKVGTMRPALWP